MGDLLCPAAESKRFQLLHTNNLSKFVFPLQGKHELLQEADMWQVLAARVLNTYALAFIAIAFHEYQMTLCFPTHLVHPGSSV
jgi:hypothetical protein